MLKELRTQHRTIIQMSFNGFKNNEIAEKMGMAPATISQILRSPLGEAYLKGLIDRSQEDTLDVRKKLISLNKDALGTIERILNPKQKAPFNVQLTAAKDVLDRNGYKPSDKFEIDVYSHKSDSEIEAEIRAMEAAVARNQIIQDNQSDTLSEDSQPEEGLASLPVSAEPQDADTAASINQPAATASQIPAKNNDSPASNSAAPADTAMTIHSKNKPSNQSQMETVPPEDDFTASDLPADIQAKLEDLSFDPFQNIEEDYSILMPDLTANMTREQKETYLKLLKEKNARLRHNKIAQFFPETGPLSRHNYPKHMQFFEMGKTKAERCIMAANRIGKSESIGAYEMTCHLTGVYPDWWKGYRFDRPINAWAAGTTSTTARDIVQYKLIGPPEDFGTGLIPQKYIMKTTPKAGGVPNAVDTILVKHISGGTSRCKIKSYAEGRKSFEGTEQDLIWLDEECPMAIYTECVTRTMTTNGLIMLTFTPLEGMTDTVLQFMPNGQLMDNTTGDKCLITATWDDAPHLTPVQKEKLYAALPPHQREARSKGVPQLGSGAIYPILESNIIVEDFSIPDHWLHCYALDVGWNRTAVIWGAKNPDTNISYLYSEYYQGAAEPIIHTEGIKSRGIWIPGVIDPAARGRSQKDGQNLFDLYWSFGLDISNANNAVESGIYKVWQLLSTGKLKIFTSLLSWLTEFRQYCRDENGKIVKKNDHLMDCTRYLVMSGFDRAIPKPFWEHLAWEESEQASELNANIITGY